MPCVYDDVPGSWGKQSEGWPSIHDPQDVARRLVIQNKLVPYGSYVTVGEYLRLETQEYVERVRAALSHQQPPPVGVTDALLAEAVEVGTLCNLAAEALLDAGRVATADALSKGALTITKLAKALSQQPAPQQPSEFKLLPLPERFPKTLENWLLNEAGEFKANTVRSDLRAMLRSYAKENIAHALRKQPPPVGVTDAVRALPAKWRAQAEAIATKHYLGIGDISDRDMLRIHADELDKSLSHQQPAPSVSEAWTEEKLRDVAKQRGWHIRESTSVPTEDGYRHPFEACIPSRDLLRMLNVPVSEPAASGRVMVVDDPACLHRAGFDAIANTPDAASGEGLLLDIQHFVAQAKKPGDLPWALIEGEVGDWLAQHGDELIRRLTTTGQGDVERLVAELRWMREKWSWRDPNAILSNAIGHEVREWMDRVDEALAPFGQQQEGQG